PCGPCSEIFYDHGPGIPGGPPGSSEEDGDRYIEIWNLVFMQFDRAEDGRLSKLPAPCVDTGMGLERLAAVLQGVHSNYEIDLFQRLIAAAQQLTGCKDHENKSLRVIADHIRACAFLIVDGVLPSNEGRGYVLRRIIRRALRHGWMLGVRGDFFWKMVAPLVAEMGEAYPELAKKQAFVEEALRAEEGRFGETLEHGMKVFDEVAAKAGKTIPGEDAFRLYDTYGFPVDLTADIARERGLMVDMAGFERAMEAQRERARAASKFESKTMLSAEVASTLAPTKFLGYETLEAKDCKVLAILRDGKAIDTLAPGESAAIILNCTPFYAESGGQVGDTGALEHAAGRFIVNDTQKFAGQFHGHVGEWKGNAPLRVGDTVLARVDAARRQATVLNHSATHLLHAALRETLGEHVTQKGSLVAPDRLRFDFSHFQPVKPEELRHIEDRVNEQIRRNDPAEIRQMAYDDAIAFGAMALFGEKYGDEVRVLRMGDFSTELCGGTHVARTGDIGLFKIVSESGVAAGIRRIEAFTGAGAMAHVVAEETRLGEVAGLLSASAGDVTDKLRHLLDRLKKLERELDGLKAKAAGAATGDLAAHAKEIDGIKLVAARVESMDAKALRDAVDTLKQKLGDCVVLLASGQDGKASLVGGVHGAALGKVKAGDMVAHVAKQIGGKGGGRPDMAQGGGVDSPALDQALGGLAEWLRQARR
ncbi:MAG: alanine--tRNA ligase, partial [Proteobacteria bacterium]|nr:alanine--tRNA ligase [Pseudomonadota bacterium]